MVHDAGPSAGRLARMRRRFPDADAVVFGHSHIPLHERDGDFQIFNPGSPTERRRSPHHAMGMAKVESGAIDFELHGAGLVTEFGVTEFGVTDPTGGSSVTTKITKTEEEWQRELTPEQYEVLRRQGTEPPFTGEYTYSKEDGMYRCAACGNELFSSDTKFESGTGWPSFYEPADGRGGRAAARRQPRHDAHRGRVRPLRRRTWATSSTTARTRPASATASTPCRSTWRRTPTSGSARACGCRGWGSPARSGAGRAGRRVARRTRTSRRRARSGRRGPARARGRPGATFAGPRSRMSTRG